MANNRDGLVQHMRQWFIRHRIETNATFITGVSGGLDSMVLVEALHRVGVEVHVAHVNYHLRGEASDADQALVERWCTERGIPCDVLDAQVTSTAHGVQAEARKIRYAHFARLRAEASDRKGRPAYIVTAHHGDDQAETVLLHLMRSADPLALAAMPAVEAERGYCVPSSPCLEATLPKRAVPGTWLTGRTLPTLNRITSETGFGTRCFPC